MVINGSIVPLAIAHNTPHTMIIMSFLSENLKSEVNDTDPSLEEESFSLDIFFVMNLLKTGVCIIWPIEFTNIIVDIIQSTMELSNTSNKE